MTQPFTSASSLSAQSTSGQVKLTEDYAEGSSRRVDSEQPAIVHPNFDPKQTPLDPARPLTDIPEPARRANSQLRRLYGKSKHFYEPTADSLSKWALIASEPFAEHLALLSAAKLIELPDSFYHNQSTQHLLMSLESMTLLDMADIQGAISAHPKLTRYGFGSTDDDKPNSHITKPATLCKLAKQYNPDELLNSIYADDWQVVLQPKDFETGIGSLATDIMACSVATHVLKQCSTRKTINQSYSAEQICHYVRSYLLSQLRNEPAKCHHYRQIRIFTGHIIIAAYHLGWDSQLSADGSCYFNISSRCGLLTRYANMQDYQINGWSN